MATPQHPHQIDAQASLHHKPATFAQDVVHAIKTAKHHVDTLLYRVHAKQYTHDDVLNGLVGIHHHLEHTESIVAVAQQAPLPAGHKGIQDIVRALFASYTTIPQEIEFTNRLLYGGPVLMKHSEDEIKQILQAAIENAVEAMAGINDAFLYVRCYLEDKNCVIEIHDNGLGFPENMDPSQLTLPYVSMKANTEERPHQGLGLYLCKKTVCEKGGNLALKPSPCGGAMFQVALPCMVGQQANGYI
jgi:signal transduction histidine kinase